MSLGLLEMVSSFELALYILQLSQNQVLNGGLDFSELSVQQVYFTTCERCYEVWKT